MKKIYINTLALGLTFAGFAAADETPLMVNPSLPSQTGAPASDTTTRAVRDFLSVRLQMSCFGTNLRSVSNPLAPQSTITANIVLDIAGKAVPFKIKFPAELTTKNGYTSDEQLKPMDPAHYTLPEGGTAAIYDNTMLIKIPRTVTYTVTGSGEVSSSGKEASVRSYSFEQAVGACGSPGPAGFGFAPRTTANCGQYYGHDGELTARINGLNVSADQSLVEVKVGFPGQEGFCGGYHSPIMLFFGEERPLFSAVSDFPLRQGVKTAWPEAGAPGYFLAMDKNGDGKISSKEELFGEAADGGRNGFEELKLLDSNGDGVIDKRDEKFASLLLWSDRNGDGISQADELEPLGKRVTKISLKYKQKVRPIGKVAEERETASFWYKDKAGKVREGKAIDMWFAPIEGAK